MNFYGNLFIILIYWYEQISDRYWTGFNNLDSASQGHGRLKVPTGLLVVQVWKTSKHPRDLGSGPFRKIRPPIFHIVPPWISIRGRIRRYFGGFPRVPKHQPFWLERWTSWKNRPVLLFVFHEEPACMDFWRLMCRFVFCSCCWLRKTPLTTLKSDDHYQRWCQTRWISCFR